MTTAAERQEGLDILLRTLIAATGYTAHESAAVVGGGDPMASPAAVRARASLRDMARDFDRLRDVVLPLGVDPDTLAWTFDLVHAEFRFGDEGSPAACAKYNLNDEQKATFMNGILDLCNFVCASEGDAGVAVVDGGDENGKSGERNGDDNTVDVELGAVPNDADLMEGIERIRVASKLRDLHGLFEQELLFEATRDVQKKMTEMMAQRADDVSADKDALLDMQKQFRKTKEKAMADLEDAKGKVEAQTQDSNDFGGRMESLFEERNGKHDEQISLLSLSDAAADYMLVQQENMLKGRQCFCLVVDRRQVRRNSYCCLSVLLIVLIVYAFMSIPGI